MAIAKVSILSTLLVPAADDWLIKYASTRLN